MTAETKNIRFLTTSMANKSWFIYLIVLISIICLAVFQDFIYSRLQNTGFYLSESLTYNLFWAFLIPIGLLCLKLLRFFTPERKATKILYLLGIAAGFSLLHITLFTTLFIGISHLLFSPAHRFSAIFNTALSNQFYIVFLFYSIGPYVYLKFWKHKNSQSDLPTNHLSTLNLKMGTTIKSISTNTIQIITTDKPYTCVYADGEKYLQDKSLKDFENELDPSIFLRVHRSAIVNKNFIKEMTSRKNGDYDVRLENGISIRFSRHFRNNWKSVLH